MPSTAADASHGAGSECSLTGQPSAKPGRELAFAHSKDEAAWRHTWSYTIRCWHGACQLLWCQAAYLQLKRPRAPGQVHALEQKGGSILGGVLAARRQAKKAGLKKPKLAEQDVALPAVPKGQTVVSFKRGMQSLPLAMADQLKDVLRYGRTLYAALGCSSLRCMPPGNSILMDPASVGHAALQWCWSFLPWERSDQDLQHSRRYWHAGLASS